MGYPGNHIPNQCQGASLQIAEPGGLQAVTDLMSGKTKDCVNGSWTPKVAHRPAHTCDTFPLSLQISEYLSGSGLNGKAYPSPAQPSPAQPAACFYAIPLFPPKYRLYHEGAGMHNWLEPQDRIHRQSCCSITTVSTGQAAATSQQRPVRQVQQHQRDVYFKNHLQ